ncbi:MAG: GntP family permease, partial [Rubripirellula sp.]
MNIWLLVFLSVLVVLVCILVFRLHAFLTLLLAGLLVAALAGDQAVRQFTEKEVAKDKMTLSEAEKLQAQPALVSAPARLAKAFGETAGKIGILIALASVIGQCLLESNAAAVIVDRMLKITGPKRAPEALAASSFLLGIPVFFDTVFYLMVPLARSLRVRLGKDYVLFILAILAGGSIAHSLVPPTPGPLLVAEMIGVDIANMMAAGLAIGACSSVVSLAFARLINSRVNVPLRFPEDDKAAAEIDRISETESKASTDDNVGSQTIAGPPLLLSLLPITIPVLFIAVGSLTSYLTKTDAIQSNIVTDSLRVLGDKNIALGFGVLFALALRSYCPVDKRDTLVSRSLA